jgi:hypothetical protein
MKDPLEAGILYQLIVQRAGMEVAIIIVDAPKAVLPSGHAEA